MSRMNEQLTQSRISLTLNYNTAEEILLKPQESEERKEMAKGIIHHYLKSVTIYPHHMMTNANKFVEGKSNQLTLNPDFNLTFLAQTGKRHSLINKTYTDYVKKYPQNTYEPMFV